MFEVNVRGTENVLEAAADIERVLYVSAVNVFGNTHGTIVDETSERTPGDRPSAYDWTKYLAHQAARGRENVVIAQPGAIYGPGDRSELDAQLEQARRGKLVLRPSPTSASTPCTSAARPPGSASSTTAAASASRTCSAA